MTDSDFSPFDNVMCNFTEIRENLMREQFKCLNAPVSAVLRAGSC